MQDIVKEHMKHKTFYFATFLCMTFFQLHSQLFGGTVKNLKLHLSSYFSKNLQRSLFALTLNGLGRIEKNT